MNDSEYKFAQSRSGYCRYSSMVSGFSPEVTTSSLWHIVQLFRHREMLCSHFVTHFAVNYCSNKLRTIAKGLCNERKIPKIRDYYGSGWVGPGLTRNFVVVENLPKITQNQCSYFGVVYHVYSICIYIAKSCWLL